MLVLLLVFKDKLPFISETVEEPVEEKTSFISKIMDYVSQTKDTIKDKVIDIFLVVKDFFLTYWIYFTIGIGILLLIIIALILLQRMKKKGRIKKVKPKPFKIEKKAAKKIKLPKFKLPKIKISKKLIMILLIIIGLIIIGGLIYYLSTLGYVGYVKNFFENRTISLFKEKNITEEIVVPEPQPINQTKEPSFISKLSDNISSFFMKYWMYILIPILILIVILFLMLIIKKIKKRNITYKEVDFADKQIILKNNKIACGEIIIKLKRTVYNVSLLLKRVRKPTFLGVDGIIYQYFVLDKENLDNQDVDQALVRFKVKKSWLKKHKIKENDVSLKRYQNKWNGVNTKLVHTDKKYCYYESVLDKLSFFVITGKPTIKPKPIKQPKILVAKKIKPKNLTKEN